MKFENHEKCDILKKCVKIPFSQNFKCLVFFEFCKPGLLPTALKFDTNFHSKLFLSKKHSLAFLIKKLWIETQLFSKTAKFLPIKQHIFRQKFSSVILALDQK